MVLNFPSVLRNSKETIEWCDLGKCMFKTLKGHKVVKKGQMVPQALREETKEYFKDLEERGVIRRSSSEWINHIRMTQNPNGNILVVYGLMALNNLVEKDLTGSKNIRKMVRAIQGSRYFIVPNSKEAFHYVEIEE